MYHRGVEMPKIVKSLSDKEISNAKPLEGEYSLSDGDGLHLLIKPDGTKQWVFITPPINNLNYVIILDGKNRRKKIITKRVV